MVVLLEAEDDFRLCSDSEIGPWAAVGNNRATLMVVVAAVPLSATKVGGWNKLLLLLCQWHITQH